MVVLGKAGSVVGLLTFGTMTSLFSKIVYEMESEGLDGTVRFFRKPWFMTALMFVGMSFCLPLAWLEERSNKRRAAAQQGNGQEPLLGNGHSEQSAKPERAEWRDALMLSIPTVFDLCATILMNIGLLTVTASVYQMMRGAEMIFAAIFAILFLGRRLNRLHYLGIACCCIGIATVGSASVFSGKGGTQVPVSKGQIILGMTLIVMSQAVQAAQITFEDYFMSEMQISPMKIVGYEGVIGSVLMGAILMPIVRLMPGKEGDGVHEDTLDSFSMIHHSRPLAIVLLVQMVGLLSYNYMGMHVTGHLGAVFRSILETMRTLFVWLVGLALFYVLRTGLGEQWDAYSFMQAAGFIVLVTGTVVYGRGDEAAASKAVEEYVAQQQHADAEAQIDSLPDPNADPAAQQPMPVPHRASSGAMVMPSSFRGAASLSANSYQEAVAASLRSRGLSVDRHA